MTFVYQGYDICHCQRNPDIHIIPTMAVSNLTKPGRASRKIKVELDEDDVVLLLKLLADLVGYIPSKLRPDTPWLRVSRQLSASFSSESTQHCALLGSVRRRCKWTDTTSS